MKKIVAFYGALFGYSVGIIWSFAFVYCLLHGLIIALSWVMQAETLLSCLSMIFLFGGGCVMILLFFTFGITCMEQMAYLFRNYRKYSKEV